MTAVVSRGSVLKRLLVGRAFSSARLEHTLLPKFLALPVFASDPLSSVAYATEESLAVLLAASAGTKGFITPISMAIAAVLAVVVVSYRQTVRAYPNGGGAYIVSRENLGQMPGLVAASALLVDYMMTVVVSVVAGVYAITSAVPSLQPHRVGLSVLFVAFVTLANLRGARESGTLFAIPTYGFVITIMLMISWGLFRCATGGCPPTEPIEPAAHVTSVVAPLSLFILLKAFSSGATALTGVEAISNGVQAFRRPQSKNAADTLLMMGVMSISMYLGISWLAVHIQGVTLSDERTVVAQIAHAVFGGGVGFYAVQAFTAAILILAANTAYQDFPRLSSILARDDYMPHQFMNRGDRLVFSNGVVGLALIASIVIYVFDADLTRLIQLYIVGVFTSFTLSQSGMVVHWLRERHKGALAARGWRRAIVINVIGAVVTGVVLIVVTATKFLGGAWLSITAMALLVPTLLSIHRHYAHVRAILSMGRARPGRVGENHVVMVVQRPDAASAEALGYARSMRPTSLRCVTYLPDGQELDAAAWDVFIGDRAPRLEPIRGRTLTSAVRDVVRHMDVADRDFVTVLVPEEVTGSLVSYLLRRSDLFRLKAALLRERHVVVADAPLVTRDGHRVGVDERPLIPSRVVTLLFVSGVNDATTRAVNYASTLRESETHAIYFDVDPEAALRIEQAWFRSGYEIPLHVVEAPFRDLTRPMLDEVRRHTARHDSVVNVVIPEVVVNHWWQLPLHNQSALFIKRLFLFEERTILTSVPWALEVRGSTVAGVARGL